MSRTGFLILVGVLTILTPFSGLPVSARAFLTVVFGICVFTVGLALRAEEVRLRTAEKPVEKVEQKEESVSAMG